MRDGLKTAFGEGKGTRAGTIVQANGKRYICFELKGEDNDDKLSEVERKYKPKTKVEYYYHEEITDF